jgi:para-aminobenzoate synthetase component 1
MHRHIPDRRSPHRAHRVGARPATPHRLEGRPRLELHEPEGAFERLEGWLRGRGFFAPGGERLVADLYLAYALSSTIRRTAAPAPPEPCPLPVLACAVRPSSYAVNNDNEHCDGRDDDELSFEVGPWRRSWSPAGYAAAVGEVRAAIGRGDVYQVNLVQHLSAPFDGSPRALAARLAPLTQPNELPFADSGWRVLEGDGWAIASGTPELLLARRGGKVWTQPIKGTRPRGRRADLVASAKDAAEHVMIVDLERNDLSRVCRPGSVRWPVLLSPRHLAGVEHLVSTVEGGLRADVGIAELLAAVFPGGSITGAPKIAAVDLIAALEPVGRGASMGALGRVHGNGDLELALTIRTFAIADGRVHLWVGGGVVWDSVPADEVAESLTKAEPLLAAIGAPLDAAARAREPAGGRR